MDQSLTGLWTQVVTPVRSIPDVFVIPDLYRRICLGRRMANTSLFINVASILWAANISPVHDEAGKPIIPDTLETVNSGVVM